MAQSLAERPDLDPAPADPGAAWSWRRWNVIGSDDGTAFADRPAGGYLRMVGTTSGAVVASVRGPKLQQQMVLTKFSRGGSAVRFILSSTGDQHDAGGPLPSAGYSVTITPTAITLRKITGGAEGAALGTGTPPNGAGTFNLRFERTATKLHFKCWPDGSAEPGAWDVEVTESALAAGVPQITWGAIVGELRIYSYVVTQAGLPPRGGLPQIHRDQTGKRIPSGAVIRPPLVDDTTDVLNTRLTAGGAAAISTDAALRRVVTVPASGTGSLAWPAFPVNALQSIRVALRGLNAPTHARTFVGFTQGGNSWGVQQVAGDEVNVTVVLPSGNVQLPAWSWNDANYHQSALAVELNFRTGQLLVWAADDDVLYAVDAVAVPAFALPAAGTSVVPTFNVTATTAAAVAVAYQGYDVRLETGTDT